MYLPSIFIFFYSLHFINSKLLFVFEHFRHGARAPWIGVSKDNIDIFNEYWNGWGEITPAGLRMEYLLGAHNLNTYGDFLSKQFNINEIEVYSTDVNRTIQSVYAQLQGMYPPSTGPTLSTEQLAQAIIPNPMTPELIEEQKRLGNYAIAEGIQVIPVKLFDLSEWNYLLNQPIICPGIKKYIDDNQETQYIKDWKYNTSKYFNDTYGEILWKYFQFQDKDYFFDWDKAYNFADTFISDYFDGRELSDFKSTGIDLKELYKDSLEISYIQTFYVELYSKNNILSIVSMSPTFTNLLIWMENRIKWYSEGKSDLIKASAPRMVIYSGHDTTLALLSFFMEEIFNIPVGDSLFAANQFFEWSVNEETNEFYVEYIYNDDKLLTISYKDFKTKIEKVLWTHDEIKDFCYGVNSVDPWFISTISLSAVVIVLTGVLVFAVYYEKKIKI